MQQCSIDGKALAENILAFSGDILGCVLTIMLAKKLERRLLVTGFAAFSLLITISTPFDLNETVKQIFNLVFRLCMTGVRYPLKLFIVEVFPTNLKGTALAFVIAISEAGATIGSFLTYLLYPISPAAVVGLFIGIAALHLVTSVLLSLTTKNRDKDLADPTAKQS